MPYGKWYGRFIGTVQVDRVEGGGGFMVLRALMDLELWPRGKQVAVFNA